MIRDKLLDFNLDSAPLELMTDGADGSDKSVHIMFFNKDSGNPAGGFELFFNSIPQYKIMSCTIGRLSIPKTCPPSGSQRIWRITKNSVSNEKQLLLHCNDLLIVEMPISSCPDKSLKDAWKQEVTKIAFHATADTASQYHRPYNTSK